MKYLAFCGSEKKHDVAQSNIVYIILKKRCLGKGGGGLQAARSNKAKMYLLQNYNKKKIFVRFPSPLFHQTHLLMTGQNSIPHIYIYSRYNLYF